MMENRIYISYIKLVSIFLMVALALLVMPVHSSPSVEAMVPNASSSEAINDLEQRIAELERMLSEVKRKQSEAMQDMQAQQEAMQMKQEEMAMQKPEKPSGFSLSPSNSKLSFYGSIRPAVTYFDHAVNDPHNFVYEIVNADNRNPRGSIELSDFFSRIGIKGETEVTDGLTAFVRGEMEVAIDQNGEFDPRLAFAGVKGRFGRLAIGRQTHPHYNAIVEVTDLFNHRSSPFGYDRQGPFRRPNLVTYSNSVTGDYGTLKLDTGLQFGHNRDDSNPGHSNYDRAGADSGSIGVSYSNDRFYLGLSHLKRNRSNGHSRDFYGLGASVKLSDKLYLATTAQGLKQGRTGNGHDNGHSLDVAGSYAMSDGYNLIVGYFDVDAVGRGVIDNSYTDGFNLTLQRQVSDNFSVFVEWLNFDYDYATPGDEDSVNSLSTGLRYDFSLDIF